MKTYEQKFWLTVDAADQADAEEAIFLIEEEIDRQLGGIVFEHRADENGERGWSLESEGEVEEC